MRMRALCPPHLKKIVHPLKRAAGHFENSYVGRDSPGAEQEELQHCELENPIFHQIQS
jgi:hypothetical protein